MCVCKNVTYDLGKKIASRYDCKQTTQGLKNKSERIEKLYICINRMLQRNI